MTDRDNELIGPGDDFYGRVKVDHEPELRSRIAALESKLAVVGECQEELSELLLNKSIMFSTTLSEVAPLMVKMNKILSHSFTCPGCERLTEENNRLGVLLHNSREDCAEKDKRLEMASELVDLFVPHKSDEWDGIEMKWVCESDCARCQLNTALSPVDNEEGVGETSKKRLDGKPECLGSPTPEPAKVLARHQPCGCVVCICDSDERCLGCGAKNCGTPGCVFSPHAGSPSPIYENAAKVLAVVEGWAYDDVEENPDLFTVEGWMNITPEKDNDFQIPVTVTVTERKEGG